MNPRHAVLILLVLAGCSNQADTLTSPMTSDSRIIPGLPPLEQANPPKIRVWTEDGWREAQKVGVYDLRPEHIYNLSIPEGQTVTFHWSAQPAGQLMGTRWAVDMVDISDETPRIDDADVTRWSQLSTSETSATIGPFTAGTHWVFIEARNQVGLKSLFPIRLEVTAPALRRAG